eukprot:gene6361-6854_t
MNLSQAHNERLCQMKCNQLAEASQIIERTKALLQSNIENDFKETLSQQSNHLNSPKTIKIDRTHSFALPVLFLASTFLSLCNLPPSQFVQYLCSLEPQLPDLNRILENVLIEIDSNVSSSSPTSASAIATAFPFPDPTPLTTTFTTAVAPHAPLYLYHKHSIKRKANHLASEELLAKVNGFILAAIYYAFHRRQHPPAVFASEQERTQYEQDLYATKKQAFLQRYHDLLQSSTILSELDLYYLVNYEYVISWIYQNIFSIGKQVNQEYVIIAGMALEGSHRILSRGGGSGNVRKVREELYRQVTGKAKQKRVKKDSPKNQSSLPLASISRSSEAREGESWAESEEEQLKSSPVTNEHSDFDKDQEHHRDSPVPMLVVDEEQQKMRIACHDPAFTSLFAASPLQSPSRTSSSITGKRSREPEFEAEVESDSCNRSPVESDDDKSQTSGRSPLHWKKKIKLMVREDSSKAEGTK